MINNLSLSKKTHMAAFEVKVSVSQSADGLVETLHDDSNYDDNTSGVTIGNVLDRALKVYDSEGTVIYDGNIPGSELTADLDVTEDKALSFVLTVTLANSSTQSGTVNYLSTRFYDIAQRDKANDLSCTCSTNKALCSNLTKAREFANAAVTFNDIGDRVSAQAQIDAANAYISLKVKGCGC